MVFVVTFIHSAYPVLLSLKHNASLRRLYLSSSSARYALHYLSRFPVIAPTSLEVVRVYLNIPAKDKACWEGVDAALNNPNFSKLRWFEIEGPIVVAEDIETFLQVVLPKSYLRGLLWVRKFLHHEPCELDHLGSDDS